MVDTNVQEYRPQTKPRRAVSHNVIRKHWASILWDKKNYDSETEFIKAKKNCFACDMDVLPLERCHLQARCYGGSDDAENLVLLCKDCHKASENCPKNANRDEYISWICQRTLMDAVLFRMAVQGFHLSCLLDPVKFNTYLRTLNE